MVECLKHYLRCLVAVSDRLVEFEGEFVSTPWLFTEYLKSVTTSVDSVKLLQPFLLLLSAELSGAVFGGPAAIFNCTAAVSLVTLTLKWLRTVTVTIVC